MRDDRHTKARAWQDLSDWLDWLELQGKRPRTLYAYERGAAPLLRDNPDLGMGEFTSSHLNTQLLLVPPRSRYISRSIYNQWFDWGLRDERIERNPMFKVPKMSAGHRRRKDIFSETEAALLEALPIPDGPLWAILFGTGLRRAEACHLQRHAIDLPRMRMIIHGKGDKDRIVPFTPAVAVAIGDLDLLERLEPDDHLWYRPRYPVGDRRRRDHPIGSTTFATWYSRGIEAAGVRYLNPHQTRHTYHWWMRSNGLDLEERQELLGHASPETTVRQYGRLDFEEIARKVAHL